MSKYASNLTVPIRPVESVLVHMPMDGAGPALLLVEMYQAVGRREDAIGIVQQMLEVNPANNIVRLSLVDLLFEDEDDDGVIETADGVTNTSDVSLGILQLKAAALRRKGMSAVAAKELTAALRKTSGRGQDLLRALRYDRAEAYEEAGQKAKAKAEWQKLYAEAPQYRDVAVRASL